MPRYLLNGIVRALGRPGHGLPWPGRPTDPGWGIEEGGGDESIGGGPIIPPRPTLPPDFERPGVPPDFEWPPLPPGLQPHPGNPLPVPPPTIEHPWVDVPTAPEEPEVWPPPGVIWPPIRPPMPGLPDLEGKTLILAALYVSGINHPPHWGWVVIDHDEVKSFLAKVVAYLKALAGSAGGIVGRPPQRPGPQPPAEPR